MSHEERRRAIHVLAAGVLGLAKPLFHINIRRISSQSLFQITYFVLENHPILQEPCFLDSVPCPWVICCFVDFLSGFSQPAEDLLKLAVCFWTIDYRSVFV